MCANEDAFCQYIYIADNLIPTYRFLANNRYIKEINFICSIIYYNFVINILLNIFIY